MSLFTTKIVSAHTVADYILNKISVEAGDSITNLKLQKIVYYGQAWSLALNATPLFREAIEAWPHGPVVPSIYKRFSKFLWKSINPYNKQAARASSEKLSIKQKKVLDDVWESYGSFSGKQLEELTHTEPPWKEAYGDRPPGAKCDTVISHESMINYYSQLLK